MKINAKKLSEQITAIQNIVEEAEFKVEPKGLTLKTMDASQISMVQYFLPNNEFTEYKEEETKFKIDLNTFNKVLKRFKNQEIEIKLDEKNSRIEVVNADNSKTSFKLPLLTCEGNEPKIPNIKFDVKVVLKGDKLIDLLNDATLMSSHVKLRVEGDEFSVIASGDKGDLRVDLSNELTIESGNEEVIAMYPVEYLNKLVKASKNSDITVEFSTDKPVNVSYKVNGAQMVYLLAPRVE